MRSRAEMVPSRHVAIAVSFIVLAVILGGGGTPNPGTEVLLQLVFVVAALVWVWLPPLQTGARKPSSTAFWLLCGLVLALPLLQLVPLPPAIWTGLPGQQDRIDALALAGAESTWQPVSRYPSRTLASLLAIFPPLFAFFITASLDTAGRFRIIGAVAAMALVTALFGAFQLSMGSNGPNLYSQHHASLTGFQANRNATSDLLLIGMAAAAAFLAPSLALKGSDEARAQVIPVTRRLAAILLVCVMFLLLFATILTGSRTGIALVPVALLASCLIIRPALADIGRRRDLPVLIALAAVLAVAGYALFGGNRALDNVVARFDLSGNRAELWQDAWFATQSAWPFGVGMGGAQPALIAAERLEILDYSLPNRVHNDYLELALEGGLPAVLLFVAVIATLAVLAARTWQARPQDRVLTGLGVTILVIAAAHSFVDYPLRSMALACLIGTGAGLLVASPGHDRRLQTSSGNRPHD